MKPKTLHNCPLCEYEGELTPEKRTFEHATIKGVKKGTWWYYKCEKCEIRFTTKESDELSMKENEKL